jgi:hypothetical protein
MRALSVILLAAALAAASGEFATGGSELFKIRGTGLFRWDFYGTEDIDPGDNMSSCAIVDWLPKLNGNVDGQFSLEFYSSSGNIMLTDLFLNLHLSENLTLKGGQFKMPFGYAYTLSSATMPFASRAAVTTTPDFAAYGGRDIGACLTAQLAPVTLDLVFSNGTGDNTSSDNDINNQFTARITGEPAQWLDLGVSVAMIGQPEIAEGEETLDSWSGMGLDAYAVAEYPLAETVSLLVSGEYLSLGYAGPEVESVDQSDAGALIFTAAAGFETGAGLVQRVRPAIRFETFSPMSYTLEGGDDPQDGKTAIDFCVNLDLFSPSNTLQLGGRNYGFEDENEEGYTDIYANWRMNF